jgi:hypothetical protein
MSDASKLLCPSFWLRVWQQAADSARPLGTRSQDLRDEASSKRYRFPHAPNTPVKFGNYANPERFSSGSSACYEAARTAQGRL